VAFYTAGDGNKFFQYKLHVPQKSPIMNSL